MSKFRTELHNSPKDFKKMGTGSTIKGYDGVYLIISTGTKSVGLLDYSTMSVMKPSVPVVDTGFISEAEIRNLLGNVEEISFGEWEFFSEGIKDMNMWCKHE